MEIEIDQEVYDQIPEMIHSDRSPVGFDAKRTHVYIIYMLQNIQRRLDALERRVPGYQ